MRSGARVLGTALIVGGILVIAWAFVVWRWGDPFTAVYTRYEQRELRREYAQRENAQRERILQQRGSAAGVPAVPHRRKLALVLGDISREAAAYGRQLDSGDPVGVLDVPRMGLHIVVVDGTDHEALKRGPGLDRRTSVPGQKRLVYIAGHRTTYGAPFAHIDRLRPGDSIRLSLPYARFHYVVTGHRIVPADMLSVLRSRGREQLALQACHPRFLATQRYIADARLARVSVLDANGSWQEYSLARG